tara:strand:- start:564 stop:812 length:249 start_codon:yes stop_codon:yes gene_type:complete
MKIEQKNELRHILKRYTDKLVDRYYVTHPPQIYKSDNVGLGYSRNENTPSQSIRFGFKTTQPTERELDSLIKVFIDMEVSNG